MHENKNYKKIMKSMDYSFRLEKWINGEKERCSGSFHLAVSFLVIKDENEDWKRSEPCGKQRL